MKVCEDSDYSPSMKKNLGQKMARWLSAQGR